MTKLSRKAVALAAVTLAALGLTAHSAKAQTTIYVYNFNDANTAGTSTPANISNLFSVDKPSGSTGSAISSSFATANIVSFGGTAINADGGDPAGSALTLQGGTSNVNNGAYITITANTTGYQNIVFSFATQKTGTGFNSDQFQYSTDGTTFTNFGSAYAPVASFTTASPTPVVSFSLGSVVDNNPNAAFRIVFNGATSSAGNNRLDNLVISGTALSVLPSTPEPSSIASTLMFLGALGLLAVYRRRKATATL